MSETPLKSVVVACESSTTLNLGLLTPFQGELKSLSKTALEQLKNQIITNGFSFPVAVWRDAEGVFHLLDGHQRVKALKSLQEDGYSIPEVPADIVSADNFTQAKMKLLGAASQFGKIEEAGLAEYIAKAQIQGSTLSKEFRLPEINIGKFLEGLADAQKDPNDLSGVPVSPTLPTEKLPASSVRMVQLFFDDKTQPEFLERAQKLAAFHGTENLTDTIMAVIRAHFISVYPNG